MFGSYKFVRSTCLIVFLLIPLLATPSSAVPSTQCAGAHGLEAGIGESQSLSVEIPSRGWLLVGVESPDNNPTWIDLAPVDCGGSKNGSFIDRGLDQGLLVVEPGTLHLRFGAVASASTGTLRLATHFIPDDTSWPRTVEESGAQGAGDAGAPPGHPFESEDRRGEDLDHDGEEGDDTEAGNGEIIPIIFDGNDHPWSNCLAGEEPFNDFSLCATQLWAGRPVQKQLGEARNLDRDYFAFDLDHSGRVHISTHGMAGVSGALLLANGRPLVVADSAAGGGAPDSFEIEADLVPGSYLVRVDGGGEANGDYQIELRTSEPVGRL